MKIPSPLWLLAGVLLHTPVARANETSDALPTPPSTREIGVAQRVTTSAVNQPVSAAESAVVASDSSDKAADPVSPQRPALAVTNCYTVGPLSDETLLEGMHKLFLYSKVDYQQRTSNESQQLGYNVFMPPFPTRQDAEAMAAILIEKGVTDYHIMTYPKKMKYSISLGLFHGRTYAQKHQDNLREKGIKADVKVIYSPIEHHWFNYRETGKQIHRSAFMRKIIAENGVQRRVVDCEK